MYNKRYYTFEDMIDDSSNRIGDRMYELKRLLAKFGVELRGLFPCFRDELHKIGVNLINKEQIVYELVFSNNLVDDVNKVEEIIKAYAREINICIHPIRVELDYTIISEKANEGQLYLTEDVIMPSANNSIESVLFPYIDNLNSNNNSLVVTDPYLYSSNDPSYIILLEDLLKRSAAKEIKSYMPQHCKNKTYNKIETDMQGLTFTFVQFPDCHDRFWICPETKKGFCMGTSLNGLGSKICRVDMLIENEVLQLMNGLGL